MLKCPTEFGLTWSFRLNWPQSKSEWIFLVIYISIWIHCLMWVSKPKVNHKIYAKHTGNSLYPYWLLKSPEHLMNKHVFPDADLYCVSFSTVYYSCEYSLYSGSRNKNWCNYVRLIPGVPQRNWMDHKSNFAINSSFLSKICQCSVQWNLFSF